MSWTKVLLQLFFVVPVFPMLIVVYNTMADKRDSMAMRITAGVSFTAYLVWSVSIVIIINNLDWLR
jgi:hypothetical protein